MIRKKDGKTLIALLRHVLSNAPLPEGLHPNWRVLISYIRKSQMESFFCSAQQGALSLLSCSEKEHFQYLLCQQQFLYCTVGLCRLFANCQIPCAVLKGAALQGCYPEKIVRTYGDIDLFIPPEYQRAVDEAMRSIDASLFAGVYSGQVGVAEYRLKNGIHVEIHYLIFGSLGNHFRSALAQAGVFSSDRFTTMEVGGFQIPIMACTDHLVYLLYHMSKHFLNRVNSQSNIHSGKSDGS